MILEIICVIVVFAWLARLQSQVSRNLKSLDWYNENWIDSDEIRSVVKWRILKENELLTEEEFQKRFNQSKSES